MMRLLTTILTGALTLSASSCHSVGKIPLISKGGGSSDSVGDWSIANVQAARNQCMIDYLTAEKNADTSSVQAFCTCLVDRAAQRYKFSEYMGDLATFRDRQQQDGQMSECRVLANMPSESFRKWMKPVAFLVDKSADETNPVSHVTRSGLKIVVYGKVVNNAYSISATLFDGKAWSAPQQIASAEGFFDPIIVSNEKDQMAILFSTASRDVAAADKLWAIQYDPGTGFAQPLQVNDTTEYAKIQNLTAAMDPRGNIIVAWDDWILDKKNADYGYTECYWRFYIVGKGWDKVFYEGSAYSPRVTVDKDNNIHSIFLRWDDSGSTSGHFAVGSFDTLTWDNDAADPFEKKKNIAVATHSLAVDTNGLVHYAVSFIDNKEDTFGKLYTSSFSATKMEWTPLKELSPNEKGYTYFTQLYPAPDGTMFAVWLQNEKTRQLVWTARYEPKNGWQVPTPIDHDASTPSQFPHLSINTKGQALALWIKKMPKSDDNWDLWGSYYNGFYWQKETKISDDAHGLKAWGPYGIMMEDGSAQAFWQQGAPSGADDGIYSAEFK